MEEIKNGKYILVDKEMQTRTHTEEKRKTRLSIARKSSFLCHHEMMNDMNCKREKGWHLRQRVRVEI